MKETDNEPLLNSLENMPAEDQKDIEIQENQIGENSWIAIRLMSIIGAGILFLAAFLSISWLSCIYFISACLFLSFSLKSRSTIILIVYTVLVLIVKIIVCVLTFMTNYFNHTDSLILDILKSTGFRFLSKDTSETILTFLPEITAFCGLFLLRKSLKSAEENEKVEINKKQPAVILHKIWYFISLGFLFIGYLFGQNACFALNSSIFL